MNRKPLYVINKKQLNISINNNENKIDNNSKKISADNIANFFIKKLFFIFRKIKIFKKF